MTENIQSSDKNTRRSHGLCLISPQFHDDYFLSTIFIRITYKRMSFSYLKQIKNISKLQYTFKNIELYPMT